MLIVWMSPQGNGVVLIELCLKKKKTKQQKNLKPNVASNR